MALGATQPKTIKGETEYLGRGVSYFGTCDGMFYRGKRIAVIVESEEGLYEVNYLSQHRRKEIYGKLRSDIGQILRQLCSYKEVEIVEA